MNPTWLLVAGLCASSSIAAPTSPVLQSWSARVSDPTNAYLQAGGMSVGPSGDVFVASHSRPAGGSYDILLTRHNAAGSLVWQKRFEQAGTAVTDELATAVVAQGTNIYVAGSINSASGGQDLLTLKYRDSGELEWAAQFDGPRHFTDLATAIAVDAQGNILVAGDSIGTDDTFDIVLVKFAPTGERLWTYYYGGPGLMWDRIAGMRVDASGNTHLLATSQADYEATMVTIKVSSAGQELWTARELSGQAYGFVGQGLDVDAAGNVVTVADESSHCVTTKYNAQGVRQWQVRYRAEEPASMLPVGIRFDPAGNPIAVANLYGSGTNDGVLIKYAPDGRQLWATRIADPGGVAHFTAWDVDASGNTIVTAAPTSDMLTVKVGTDGVQLGSVVFDSGGSFTDYSQFLEVTAANDILVAGRSVYFSESFVSLVKYTQQPVPGLPTASITPALHLVDPGTNVTFTALIAAPGPVHIQWRMNGRVLPDATNTTLTLANVQVENRGDYSVVLSNPAGATVSAEARLSVRTLPSVELDPTNATSYLGTDAAFMAIVPGNEFVTLQWRHAGINLPGATNAILRLTNLTAAAAGQYDIVVSSVGGTLTSSPARLRISSAVTLAGVTPHRSSPSSWDYTPQLSVLPNGDSLLAVKTNHPTRGSSILLFKQAADGALLWSTLFDSPAFTNAEPSRMARDAAGNIFVTGLSRQPFIAAAVALLKFSPDGALLWSRMVEATNFWNNNHALAVDPDGNSTLGILDGHGTTVIRRDSAGDVQWTFEDLSTDTETLSLAVDAAGHSYVGTTIRVNGDNQIRLRRIDDSGATAWVRAYAEGMYNRLGAIAVDTAGNLIVAGAGEVTVSDSRMFVLKYSSDGQKLWETRTGNSYTEISYILALAVGPQNEITVLTMSDDDYTPEQSGLTGIGPDGEFRYRIGNPDVLVQHPSQLALDGFGNAYITGYGARRATGVDVMTAKYDARGVRQWQVAHGGRSWEYGLAVGADAAGVIRVLATTGVRSNEEAEFLLLRYVQRDPAGVFRLRLIRDAANAFHLSAPAGEAFRIEASTDMQSWTEVEAGEAQQLLQPGGTPFSQHSQRFFRLILSE